jgi:hypothetical protein
MPYIVGTLPYFADGSGLFGSSEASPNGNCHGLHMARKSATGFEVRELGRRKSSVEFDYRIVACRRGYEKERLEVVEPIRSSR